VWIALRYLFARRSALSYVSRLALLGLILSVAVLVVVLSVVNGFERELRERVLGVLPHITAEAYGGLSSADVQAFSDGGPYPGLQAVAPYVSGTVLLAAGDVIQGALLTGVDSQRHGEVTDIPRYTTQGSLQSLDSTRYGIILGRKLAAQLGVSVGEQLLVVLPVGAVTPAGAIPRQRRFTLVDVFDSNSLLDGQQALISLGSAQKLFRTGSRVHGVQGRLLNLFDTEPARMAMYRGLGEEQVRVRSWMTTQGNLYQAIAVQKLTMFILLSFLVAVAAFNLVSGLMMIVEQRKNDVAVLRTLGAGAGAVLWLFCTLGLMLALSGILFGLLGGSLLAASLPWIYSSLSGAFDLDLMSQYFIGYLPVDIRLADLVQVGVAALLLTLCATLYPAWRATHLLPSRVLAHE